MVDALSHWLDEHCATRNSWCAKRLSANDTLANGSHQAGPYLPKQFLFFIFPQIATINCQNPDHWFDLSIDSHFEKRRVRAIYYNSKRVEGRENGRDETRLTNFGGKSSALLNPNNTGALVIFSFINTTDKEIKCHVWICRTIAEEEYVETRIGPVEPGRMILSKTGTKTETIERKSCWLSLAEIPSEWLVDFPSGQEIIHKVISLRDDTKISPDKRLLRRRECEFEIFRSLEEAIELPRIKKGFTDIDDFLICAQTIVQRRKARSGRSLELHLRQIFLEERLNEGTDFVHGAESDPGKRPDFLFPSAAAYRDPSFPTEKLRMLAVKTTCRDRWRQILNEADRIPEKHLLTLQEGISEAQFREMRDANVTLVVPQPLLTTYPVEIRHALLTVEGFLAALRQL